MSKRATSSWAALAALCLALPATAAGPVPAGVPFPASGCTNCAQRDPAVAGSPTGDFLVVWEGEGGSGPESVAGRLFHGSGVPAGGDFEPASGAGAKRRHAAVAADGAGYLAAWSEEAAGTSDVFVRRFLANGQPAGAAIPVSGDGFGLPGQPADLEPALARTRDGGFVVVWIRVPAPGALGDGTPQVAARRFAKTGAPLGPIVKLNLGLVHAGGRPDVCVDTAGRILAVWTSVDAFPPFQANRKGVSLRRLSPALAPLAGEQLVARPLSREAPATISCGRGNTSVVVWQSDREPAADRADVLAQRYTRKGRRAGPTFVVPSDPLGDQKHPAVSHEPAGGFVVVWEGDAGIAGRRFAANGTPAGADFDVAASGSASDPEIAHAGGAGDFVVVWQDGLHGVFGRRFASGGTAAANGEIDLAEDPATDGRE